MQHYYFSKTAGCCQGISKIFSADQQKLQLRRTQTAKQNGHCHSTVSEKCLD